VTPEVVIGEVPQRRAGGQRPEHEPPLRAQRHPRASHLLREGRPPDAAAALRHRRLTCCGSRARSEAMRGQSGSRWIATLRARLLRGHPRISRQGEPLVQRVDERWTHQDGPVVGLVWRPMYQRGTTVRFTNQRPTLLAGAGQTSNWGPARFAHFQNGTHPVVVFSPSLFFAEPDWLIGPRAPDVSSRFAWFPLVTGRQVLFDLANAGESRGASATCTSPARILTDGSR